MTVNKKQFCSQCQVLTLPTSKFCPHCGNELALVPIESGTISIEPGLILIDRYQIYEQLITDDTREFLAQDLQSQDLVIIKNLYRNENDFYLEKIGLTLEDLELFKQQVLSWSDLQHPAIPKYLDAFYFGDSIDTGIFVVRAYINAPSIGTVIRAGRKFSDPEVIELADRLLAILIYTHGCANPVIHGNISPETILLVERPDDPIGDIYLTGFGLSPTPNIQNWLHDYQGPIYRFPNYYKFFADSAHVSDDLNSLGMTLSYLLTGDSLMSFCTNNSQVDTKLSNWIDRLIYYFYTEDLSDRKFLKSAASARVALNTEDVRLSSISIPPSSDPDPTASTPPLDKHPSRSSNRSLYLQLILIGTIFSLGWIVVAKNSVPTVDRQQDRPSRSVSK
jgi:hypothetical protein